MFMDMNNGTSAVGSEYVLTGRFWRIGFQAVLAACLAFGFYEFHFDDNPPRVPGMLLRSLGVDFPTQMLLISAILGALAFFAIIWMLVAERCARKVVVSAESLFVYPWMARHRPPLIISWRDIADVQRGAFPVTSKHKRFKYDTLRFKYKGRRFDFPRLDFRNNHEFNAFCDSIGRLCGSGVSAE